MDSTEILVAFLGGNACAALVTGIIGLISSKRAVRDGVKELLRDRIKMQGLEHIQQGFIYDDDLDDLIRMHKIYHDDLKGNGYLKRIMGEVEKLPIKKR